MLRRRRHKKFYWRRDLMRTVSPATPFSEGSRTELLSKTWNSVIMIKKPYSLAYTNIRYGGTVTLDLKPLNKYIYIYTHICIYIYTYVYIYIYFFLSLSLPHSGNLVYFILTANQKTSPPAPRPCHGVRSRGPRG